jgi:hypothetical protein
MGPEAMHLMRAIKEHYPDMRAGSVVDPFGAVADVGLDPHDPGFRVGLHELLEADVLRHSTAPEHLTPSTMGMNPRFEVTSEGEARIARADQ